MEIIIRQYKCIDICMGREIHKTHPPDPPKPIPIVVGMGFGGYG